MVGAGASVPASIRLAMSAAATFDDTRLLKARLRRAERRKRLFAFLLVAPLFAYTLLIFVAPIADMLRRSVIDNEMGRAFPQVARALASWDDQTGTGVPGEDVFAALASDMKTSWAARETASAARRLNYDLINGRSLVMNTARSVAGLDADPASWRDAIVELDERWGEPDTWRAMERARGPVSDFFLLASVDRKRDADGGVVLVPPQERLYVDVYIRTFTIAFTVTFFCLVLGFPAAYLLATLPPRVGNLMLILVLLPFWTPLLVRTGAWVVVLQENGFVNQTIMWLGLSDGPVRLIYNRVGVIIAMTHVLLPFMILPAYSVMKTIPPDYMRAARSLGAPPTTAFFRVYMPQALPGLAAGALLVFIIALGYYITPALVGGAGDRMVSSFIALYTTGTVNWGLAAALGTGLLVATLILYAVYARLVGGARMGAV